MILTDPMADLSNNRGGVYCIVNAPLMYRLNRFVAAPGGVLDLRRFVRRWAGELSAEGERTRRCLRAGLLADRVRSFWERARRSRSGLRFFTVARLELSQLSQRRQLD